MKYLLSLMLVYNLHAISEYNSIIEIPRGTTFTLNHELEIPANRDYIILGFDRLNETFNKLNQSHNSQTGKYYNDFDSYIIEYRQKVDRTYNECINRHKRYFTYGGSSSGANTIVNQGQGNTNIIVNTQSATTPKVGSYIDNNYCIKPEHTFSALMINKHNADTGGIFRDGYTFNVRKVSHYIDGIYHVVNIYFDHEVAKGIKVVSTISSENIKIYQLYNKPNSNSNSIWGDIANGINQVVNTIGNITGDHFSISFPKKRYFE